MFIHILLSIIIFPIKILCEDNDHCLYRKNDICIKCEENYILVGTSEFSLDNIITCELESNVLYPHFENDDKVSYPCTNGEYGYLKNDESKCFRKNTLSINYYYSKDLKHFYPCDTTDEINLINGIANCHNCKLTTEGLKCTLCNYYFAFKDDNYTTCYSREELSRDTTIFKDDDNNYRTCVINNCFSCSSRSVCTKCEEGFALKNYVRYKCFDISEITPINEYYTEDNNVYYSCGLFGGVEHCKTCDSKTKCTLCENGYTILDDDDTQCIKITELKSNLFYERNNKQNYYSCINYDNENKHCLECNFQDINNFICLKCEPGYYFLEDQGDNCINEISISKEYYKYDDDLYKLCSSAIEGCKYCDNNKKCTVCLNEGFGILDLNYTVCEDVHEGLDGNTIYQEDELFYTCEKQIEGCKKCLSKNNCIETLSSEYCILNEDRTVYKLNISSDIYYHSTSGDDLCISCENIFSYCFLCKSESECIQCTEGYSLIDKEECDYKAAFEINDQYFSDDNFTNFYKCNNTLISSNAIDNCFKCEFSSENKCKECLDGYIILDNEDHICILNSSSIQAQIENKKITGNELGTKYYTCSKWLENCDTCEDIDICSTCKDNYVFLNGNKTKCYLKDNFIHGHFFTNDSGINYYSCIANCSLCEDDEYCITCDKGFELNDFGTKCNLILNSDEEIKENCVYLTENVEIDINNINNYINSFAYYYWLNYREEKNYLVKYTDKEIGCEIIIFKNYQCSLYLYEEDSKFKIDTSVLITELKKYMNNKETIQVIFLYKNHTGINFYENINGNHIDINTMCPSCLQKKYKIINNYGNKLKTEIGPKFTSLIQEKKIDIFNELSPYFQDFCQNLQISGIDIPLNQRQYLLYKGNLSYNLGDNSKGDFYACNINCTLINNNIDELISECECDIHYDINELINTADEITEMNEENAVEKKEIKDEYNFLDNSNDAFSMFSCTKDAFIGENIKSNPGFYTVTLGMVTQSIFFIVLICKQRIGSFAKLLVLANPPKSKTIDGKGSKRIVHRLTDNDYFLAESEEKEKEKNKYNYVNKETNTFVPISIKEISNSESKSNSEKSESENENEKDNGENYHQRMNIYKGNKLNLQIEGDKNIDYEFYPIMKFLEFDVNVYRDVGYTNDQKDIKELKKKYEGVKMIKYNLLFKNEKNKILPLIYKPVLVDFLPYKYAQYYDKRSLGDLYKYFLCLRHPIINLCFNSNNISQNFIPFSMKAIKILFCGMLILFFNSLLITQQYLYEKFNFFNEKYDFKNMQLNDDIVYSEKIKYAIRKNSSNSFWTYIIVLIFDVVLSLILSVRFRIKNLLDEFYEIDSGKNSVVNKNKKQEKNFEKELLNVSDLKNIFLFTTIIFFVFFIAFFIYIINFCHAYKAENPDLFFSSLWSFLFYISFPFITNFILSFLRHISLKEDCEFIFNISKILIEF